MENKLQTNIDKVKEICLLIDRGDNYKEKMNLYFLEMNKMVELVIKNGLVNEQFVIQVLNDILYAVEHEDVVILKDTLRYGLLEIYYYIDENYQCEEIYE